MIATARAEKAMEDHLAAKEAAFGADADTADARAATVVVAEVADAAEEEETKAPVEDGIETKRSAACSSTETAVAGSVAALEKDESAQENKEGDAAAASASPASPSARAAAKVAVMKQEAAKHAAAGGEVGVFGRLISEAADATVAEIKEMATSVVKQEDAAVGSAVVAAMAGTKVTDVEELD